MPDETAPTTSRAELPLHAAARVADLDAVRRLLADGADVDERDGQQQRTALFVAVERDAVSIVAALLAAGADAAVRDIRGVVPLHLASSVDVVRLLIGSRAGVAVVNACDDSGWTPVRQVASMASPALTALLLEHGADPHLRDPWGATALHVARSAETVRLLLAAGAFVHVVNERGQTPLHTVGTAEASRVLLQAGADVHATDHSGRTPLHEATDAELIRLLLDAGARVDLPDGRGWTPLAHRVHFLAGVQREPDGAVRAVQTLLAAGASLTCRAADGVAAIHRVRRSPTIMRDNEQEAALRRRLRRVCEDALGGADADLRRPVEPGRTVGLAQDALAVHPREPQAVTACGDGLFVRWSLGGMGIPAPVEVVATDRPRFGVLAVSPDGALLAAGCGEDEHPELRRWDRLDEVVAVLDEVPYADRLVWSPDGRWLAAGWWEPGGDGLAIVDVATGRTALVDGYPHGVEALAVAPDGTLVVSWLTDRPDRMGLYRVSGDEIDEIDLLADIDCRAEAMAVTADGRRLAVCGPAPDDSRSSDTEPGLIAMFDMVSRQPLWSLPIGRSFKRALSRFDEPTKPVCLCLVADDRLLAVGLRGGLVFVSTDTGRVVKASRWPGDVRAVHPTPNGGGVLVAARDGHHLVPCPR